MKSSKLLLVSMLVVSWVSVPFLGKDALKKYLPSAIFICVLTKLLDNFGERKKWWRFYKGIPPLGSMDFFNFGPYFVTSLWMLKMLYGKFWLFLISNTLLQTVFIFWGLKYVKRFKILSLIVMTKLQYLGVDFLRTLILYGFQWLKESITDKKPKQSSNGS